MLFLFVVLSDKNAKRKNNGSENSGFASLNLPLVKKNGSIEHLVARLIVTQVFN